MNSGELNCDYGSESTGILFFIVQQFRLGNTGNPDTDKKYLQKICTYLWQ